jgi:hypothetical protein
MRGSSLLVNDELQLNEPESNQRGGALFLNLAFFIQPSAASLTGADKKTFTTRG